MTHREGWGGWNASYDATYTNNKRDGIAYDAAGNHVNDGGWYFQYDVAGRQTQASAGSYVLQQSYDGDGQRVRKVENGQTTYYLRSSVLSGQVICEIDGGGVWQKGYVYLGGQMLAMQQAGTVTYVHQDPVTKSQRFTDTSGTATSTRIELDPFGGDTNQSANGNSQPYKYTSYERDGNGSDYAMARSRNTWFSRFYQPDPYDGSYNMADPQSFNRYAYTQNDPVNFVDPSGLDGLGAAGSSCGSNGRVVQDDDGSRYCAEVGAEFTVSGGGGGSIGAADIFSSVAASLRIRLYRYPLRVAVVVGLASVMAGMNKQVKILT